METITEPIDKNLRYKTYQREYQRTYQKNAYRNNAEIRNKKKIKYYLNNYKDFIPTIQDIIDDEDMTDIEKLQQIVSLVGVYRITRSSI